MRFFLMFIIAVCVLLFLIKLRWLKNRGIYKLANIKPPKNPWNKIEPPTPTNPMPILIETCKLKTYNFYFLHLNFSSFSFYFLHLNLILKLMVAGLLLLLHLLFGMHFHSNLDLVIPFLLLNLSSRLGFLKLVMMLSYRMMMFL